MNENITTNVNELITDLGGGVFEQKLSKVLSEVAGAVIDHDAPGKIIITFDLKRIANSYQVTVSHKLAYVRPTSRGKKSEEDTTTTPMHVGTNGNLSVFPENQTQMFDKKGGIATDQENL